MNMEKLSVPIAIVISGALIAGALYYSNLKGPTTAGTVDTTTETTTTEMRTITSDDHILGNPNADLIIVEYSDTECPYCKVFHNTLKRVMNEYGKDGKVAWVYRHFPIDQLHSKARKESEATECAYDQGGNEKFWEYINMLYDVTNSNDSLDPSELPKIAKSVGLNVDTFNTCLSSGKYAAKVEADYQDAIKAGGRGTPNSIIISKDGTKTVVEGAQPYENLKNIIDALLK
ncbi:MAG: Thioredoxin protein [Patescibacteria group bacterium]|jgi:protein-disulfide isomerase|nr:Thioredoxin protein [Patescibacteria group bacterium]